MAQEGLTTGLQQSADTGDAGKTGETITGGTTADTANAFGNDSEAAKNTGADVNKGNDSTEALNAEIERLKAAIEKQKNAVNDATKEAAEYKRQLRAQMTAEQIAAKEKEEADQKAAKELEDLRREVAKGKTVKTVMGKLGLDEDSAGNLADHLFGAADIENALLEIQKAWQAKEAALRKEFGKITGPGAGADSNSPEALAVKRAAEIGKARNAVNEQAQKAMSAYLR